MTPIFGFCNCSFCCTFLYVPSSFAIILMGKRELVALVGLSSWCLVIAVWLFLTVPWVGLQFVIVVFPDYTHLLFSLQIYQVLMQFYTQLDHQSKRLCIGLPSRCNHETKRCKGVLMQVFRSIFVTFRKLNANVFDIFNL